jgi:phage shock protein C
MNQYRYNYKTVLPEGLVRDAINGKVAGVCAGLGGYFSIKTKWVRLLFILTAILTSFIPVVIAYIILAILMPPAPAGFAYDNFVNDPQPGPGQPAAHPVYTNLREHFATLDHRMANMEAWVTSEDYRLRQKFKNL